MGGGGWGEVDGAPPLGFHYVEAQRNKFTLIHSPKLARQRNTTFVGCDVVRCQMTSFDLQSWICRLDFYYFLKKSNRKTETNGKSSHNAFKLNKFVNFWNLMNKTGKKVQNDVKKLILVRPE